MRVVLDTNILIGALITKGTPPDRLYQAWLRGEIELVTSTAQIAEMADVLVRPRLQRFLDADEAKAIAENMGRRRYAKHLSYRPDRLTGVRPGHYSFTKIIRQRSSHACRPPPPADTVNHNKRFTEA